MKNNFNERDIDKGIEIWQLNDIETWVGWSLEEIINAAMKHTGLNREEVVDNPRKVPRSLWDSTFVADTDSKFCPRYTYSNMIMKDTLDNVEMPYMLASTEC